MMLVKTKILLVLIAVIEFVQEVSSNELQSPPPIKITHLHEVSEHPTTASAADLNIGEIYPTSSAPKPIRKKPYAILEKPSGIDKQRQKEYESESEVLDLSIDHLDDEHQSIKDIGLSQSEQDLLLSDSDDRDSSRHAKQVVIQHYPSSTLADNLIESGKNNQIDGISKQHASNKLHTSIHIGTLTTPSPFIAASTSSAESSTHSGLPQTNIFRVASKNKAKSKGRNSLHKVEAYKSFANHGGYNQLAESKGAGLTGYHNHQHNAAHLTFDIEQQEANVFRVFVNAYDHYQWQPVEIRKKLSPVCGVELQAYLTALNMNYDWAQKAYDASGHYRGQLFFGNNLWLGQKTFCHEVNRILATERSHFEFDYSVSTIKFATSLPTNISSIIQLGECLPKSCSADDVKQILDADPHVRYLMTLNSTSSSPAPHQFHVVQVRHVPGNYSLWKEMKFKIVCAILVCIVALICFATWLEIHINRRTLNLHLQNKMATLSSKYETDNGMTKLNGNGVMVTAASAGATKLPLATIDCGKDNRIQFELYQLDSNCGADGGIDGSNRHRCLEDNNNFEIDVSTTAAATDLRKLNGYDDADYENHNETGNLNGKYNDNGKISQSNNNNNHFVGSSEPYGLETKQITPHMTLGFFEELILCFSLPRNIAAICTFKRKNEEILSCVHGIRLFSLLWTIMVHTYLQMFLIGENRFKRNIAERSFAYQVIGNATFSVDSFFFLSGLLVVMIFLKNEKRKELNPTQFVSKGCKQSMFLILYRYVRLTPAYLFVIVFTELSMNFVFNRTVHIPTGANEACTNYWWRNILYINNFYPFSELCMIWSWYLANDMQFYIFAVIILILSTRYLKFSIITTLFLLLISWGTAGVVSIHHQYIHKVSEPFESFDFLYDKPWQRIGPYIIGMATGYIIFKCKKPPKIPFLLNALLWFLSIGLLFILIFGVWNGTLNVLMTAFYVSVGHTAWGLGLVWITLSCYWNMAPAINKFLSYDLFLPFSRLTYCTYLIHPTIMMITSFEMEGPIHLQHTFILTVFLGNAVLSFLVAFLISVLFEAPIIRLTKIFIHKN